MSERAERAIHPLTLDRWADLERLFGARGACGGCWCQWWRLDRAVFNAGKGERNREALRALVAAGDMPGLLVYDGEEPVAWCSVAPRDRFPGLARSRILRPVDDTPVWSIVCLFVRRSHRGRGLTADVLRGVVGYVRACGGDVVEGYPVEPAHGRLADAFAWTGFASAFRKAGFVEVARRSDSRPVMRYYLRASSPEPAAGPAPRA